MRPINWQFVAFAVLALALSALMVFIHRWITAWNLVVMAGALVVAAVGVHKIRKRRRARKDLRAEGTDGLPRSR